MTRLGECQRRVLFHRASAVVWALLLIPALLWWSESVLFVIVASVYANVKSDWGAAEAADDRSVTERLDRIERLLTQPQADGPTTPAPINDAACRARTV